MKKILFVFTFLFLGLPSILPAMHQSLERTQKILHHLNPSSISTNATYNSTNTYDESEYFGTLKLTQKELLFNAQNNLIGAVKFTEKDHDGFVHAKLLSNANKIIGSCVYCVVKTQNAQEGILEKIYVKKEYRHKNYGRALILWTARKLINEGCYIMRLKAGSFEHQEPPPAEAQKLLIDYYKRLGGEQYIPEGVLSIYGENPFFKFNLTNLLTSPRSMD